MRLFLGLLFILAIGGCAQPDDPGDQTLPPAFSGFFHHDAVDAVNLRISDDGTFQWTIYGCDFGATVDGVWTRSGETIVLRSADAAPLDWSHGGSFRFQVDHVEVVAIDGRLDAVGKTATHGVAFEQSWAAGGVCAVCGGPLGPTGQCACADPFTAGVCP
ncbi:MAG TPA: hypothetical protein VIV11_31225 [Kofleriaceae bacterium]